MCEEHGIELRVCHTPGAMLHRPDQTSRGDPVEEPRQRLSAAAYGELVAQWGPFTEWIGAERRHAQPSAEGQVDRLWVHPTHSTVGSALRLIGERLGEAGERSTRGIIVVPHDESAEWWRMTRHFGVVGRLPAGGRYLEANVLGEWRAATARRELVVLAFPRAEAESAERLRLARVLSEESPAEASAGQRWLGARVAADEAAAARRHVLPAASVRPPRRKPAAVVRPGTLQRCQYRGTVCAGCGQLLRRGEQTHTAGGGLVHPREGCARQAEGRRAQRALLCDVQAASQTAAEQEMDDARAYSVWAQMEREFALGDDSGSRRLLLPRHSRERFMELLRWMASDAGRRELLPVVRRAVGIYTRQTRLRDWGRDAEVRRLFSELEES